MTVICVLGAAGRTGRIITSHLFASGREVRAAVHRPETVPVVLHLRRGMGPGARVIEPTVVDVLGPADDLTELFRGCAAVVNAAGTYESSPTHADINGDGPGAIIEAMKRSGVHRLLHVSCMYADRVDEAPDYLRALATAKHAGEQLVRDSHLDWTVIRPGPLADSGATGQLSLAGHLKEPTPVSREDVAAVIGACVALNETVGHAFDVTGGTTYLLTALDVLTGRTPSRAA